MNDKFAYAPQGFLRLPQVLQLIPVSKSTWWSGINQGIYPAGIKISRNITAWYSKDILSLVEQLRTKNS